MITQDDYRRMDEWLRRYSRPLLVSHRRADGDALGALAAITRVLAKRGQDPRATLFDDFPARYELLRDAVPWWLWEDVSAEVASTCDALIILDTCALAQLEPAGGLLTAPPPTLVVDHHATADSIGTRSEDLRLCDVSAAATCVLLAEWVETVAAPLDDQIATALYVGVATDTGWFRYSNTDARTLRAAATLIDAGADSQHIYQGVHEREPRAKLALMGRLLSSMELMADGRLAVLRLRLADFSAAGADHSMTEDLVNVASTLAGLEATIMFTEHADGSVRVNLRSKRWLDVAAIARQFGGGGHHRAAGATPPGNWDDVVPRVIAATTQALENHPAAQADTNAD